MKKRERTLNLVSESEILETQNVDLKSQVRNLEMERQKLTEMLQTHGSSCIRHEGFQPPLGCPLIVISKYINDITVCEQQQPIPSVTTIKFGHHSKSNKSKIRNNLSHHNLHHKQHNQQSSQQHHQVIDIGYCKSSQSGSDLQTILSPNYCKPSPSSEGYELSPDSVFIKSSVDVNYANNINNPNNNNLLHHVKSDYIPNCDNSNSDVCGVGRMDNEFTALKCELIDINSPYTTVQSANRFLFDGTENFDSNIVAGSQNLKLNNNNSSLDINRNNNNNNNSATTTTTIIEFSGQCQNLDGHSLKTDFLSHNSEFLALVDCSEAQFTDLDSGVTTFTNMMNNNSGCMA